MVMINYYLTKFLTKTTKFANQELYYSINLKFGPSLVLEDQKIKDWIILSDSN